MPYQPVGRCRAQIYGIAGRKQHGKDTFAKAVVAASKALHKPSDFEITHFADPLKNMAMDVFGLSEDQLYDETLKDAPLPSPIIMDLFVEGMKRVTSLPIKPRGLVARTPREVAQFFGTEYVRSVQGDYWIRKTVDRLAPKGPAGRRSRRVLISDTRFPNEAHALREIGGKVVKIVRIDAPPRVNEHDSEKAVDQIEPDLLLGVRTGNLALVERVAKLLAWNKFESALSFDYRMVKPAMEAYAGGASAEVTAEKLNHKSAGIVYFLADYYGIPSRAKSCSSRVPHEMRDGTEHKWCSRCSSWKPLVAFNVYFNAWDKLNGWCRGCASEANRVRDYTMEGMFKLMKKGAGSRGKDWSLSFEDVENLWVKQAGLCAYTGQPMTLEPRDPNKVSIDRIDPKKGYEPANIVLCGQRVNFMKRDLDVATFVNTCAKIVEYSQGPEGKAEAFVDMLLNIQDKPLYEPSREEIEEAQEAVGMPGTATHAFYAKEAALEMNTLEDGIRAMSIEEMILVRPNMPQQTRELLEQRAADIKAGKLLEYDEAQKDVPPMLRKPKQP